MDNNKVNILGLNAQIALMRTQLDALIEILDSDKKETFEKLTFEKVSKVYIAMEKTLNPQDFKLFRDMIEDGLLRK